jgi:hypothetical protein
VIRRRCALGLVVGEDGVRDRRVATRRS